MKKIDDFAVFILTHGRPDRIHTLKTLEKQGYTGWIPVLLFVPFIISLAYTWINAKGADMFVGNGNETTKQ